MLKLLNTYKGISQANVGVGDTIMLWGDLWNERILQNDYPELFSFAKNSLITVSADVQSDD
jgi:hypothetical protein